MKGKVEVWISREPVQEAEDMNKEKQVVSLRF